MKTRHVHFVNVVRNGRVEVMKVSHNTFMKIKYDHAVCPLTSQGVRDLDKMAREPR